MAHMHIDNLRPPISNKRRHVQTSRWIPAKKTNLVFRKIGAFRFNSLTIIPGLKSKFRLTMSINWLGVLSDVP